MTGPEADAPPAAVAATPPTGTDRRGAVLLGVAALGGAAVAAGAVAAGGGLARGAAPTPSPTPTPTPGAAAPALRRFRSTMATMPAVTAHVLKDRAPAAGLLLASPVTDVATGVILDDAAEPVWIDPEGRYVMDLDVQTYQGRPVLTFWSGKFIAGHGIGACTILDTAYRPVATVRTGLGLAADMHEFRLTPQGTALVLSYPTVTADLSPIGGPPAGWVLGGRVQEVDVASGEVLLDWEALDHIPITETFQPVPPSGPGSGRTADSAFDPVHLNSVALDGEDALLVSARHTHTVYRIDRRTGAVRWRMGGRRSDFTVEPAARFAWQHDARRLEDGAITLFDNHRKDPPGVSAGLVLDIDESTRTVSLRQRYASAGHFGFAEGSMQRLDGGHVLVGWGKDTSATEYTAAGDPVLELRSLGIDNYRVRRRAWTAQPDTLPDVAATRQADGLHVFASWNGATEVSAWRIATGPTGADPLDRVVAPRSGFETQSVVDDGVGAIRVTALDAAGRSLASSRILTV